MLDEYIKLKYGNDEKAHELCESIIRLIALYSTDFISALSDENYHIELIDAQTYSTLQELKASGVEVQCSIGL